MYRLELYEQELKSTRTGKEIMQLITMHIDEVSNLINHNREVMVTWQRNKGAVFFSQFMGSGFDTHAVVKNEMEGIHIASVIRRMAVVLQDHGSATLSKAIDQHLLLVLGYAEKCNSLNQIFQELRRHG
jgi:hypothetical protein